MFIHMQKVTTPVETFIKSLPQDIQPDIATLDKEISKIMKGETRILWGGKFWGGSDQSIIGYGDLAFVGSNKKEIEWFKVGLALQKNYISIYISAVDAKGYIAEKYGKTIGKVKVGKSSISFKKLDDIDLDKLLDVIKQAKMLMK